MECVIGVKQEEEEGMYIHSVGEALVLFLFLLCSVNSIYFILKKEENRFIHY